MPNTLQGDLQQSLRGLSGQAWDFNGDAVAAADALDVDASNVTGSLIGLAQTLEPSIDSVTAAANYLLTHHELLGEPQ